VFADIPKVDTVILMGPNHYGLGPDISVSLAGSWETPLWRVWVDERMAAELTTEFPVEKMDEMAHLREHSIEVQLPFLQTVLDEFKIVPISIKHYAPDKRFLEVCEGLSKAIASVVKESKGKTLVVSSTDFTHYEPSVVARKKDEMAMRMIEKLDAEGLFKVISDNDISMCGYAGVAANIAACRALGAKKAERVAYMTSGDTTGDNSAVVGYGGLRIV
jgi:AmmeMemoRadiSam system protein B